ncbi:hypothetical protein FGO68_gene4985 [Halteria grandinella]|uniref:Uncharacterized protein n=1 Tax=Halteria grandinella TaxID=5974 RepID=A0A8J8NH88_HALGN|nr:hypothetical protein FGO68_gene4985 [Halteria grandinella]
MGLCQSTYNQLCSFKSPTDDVYSAPPPHTSANQDYRNQRDRKRSVTITEPSLQELMRTQSNRQEELEFQSRFMNLTKNKSDEYMFQSTTVIPQVLEVAFEDEGENQQEGMLMESVGMEALQ